MNGNIRAHNCSFRVYYEDTDAGGVVYYANYLKFAERARTEMLRSCGINQSKLAEKKGVYFVVRHAEIDFKKSARLDDQLEIDTKITGINGASITMEQDIKCGRQILVAVRTTIACVNNSFRPVRITSELRAILNQE